MIELPWGEKWVARFKNPDGTENIGICNHHNALSPLVSAILNTGGRDIRITDETLRPHIIEGTMEVMNEGNSQLENLP